MKGSRNTTKFGPRSRLGRRVGAALLGLLVLATPPALLGVSATAARAATTTYPAPFNSTGFSNCNRSTGLYTYTDVSVGGVSSLRCWFPTVSWLYTLSGYPIVYRNTYGWGYKQGQATQRLAVDSELQKTDCRSMCTGSYGIVHWGNVTGTRDVNSEPSATVPNTYDWLYLESDVYVYAPGTRFVCPESAWYYGDGTLYSTSTLSCRVG